MSIKHPCCFCYTVAPAFVQLVHVYVLAYAGASKWAQWTATAKSCKDKLLCNAFWQMRLSWVVLLLIYRADASRSWAVGRQKFREIRSCCWLRGSLLWYFNWIRWAATEKADASGTLPFTWKGLSPHRPRTTGKTCVRTCRGRSAWWLFVCLLHLTVRRQGLIRLDMPPSVLFGAVEKYSALQRRALTQIHQAKCFIFSLSHFFLEQRLL